MPKSDQVAGWKYKGEESQYIERLNPTHDIGLKRLRERRAEAKREAAPNRLQNELTTMNPRPYFFQPIRPIHNQVLPDFSEAIAGDPEYDYWVRSSIASKAKTLYEFQIYCGPRFCGQIGMPEIGHCGHGMLVWGDRPPPDWIMGIGWENDKNPFFLLTPDEDERMWFLYDEERKVMVQNPKLDQYPDGNGPVGRYPVQTKPTLTGVELYPELPRTMESTTDTSNSGTNTDIAMAD